MALCQCTPLYHSGTMPMYTYTSIFLWNSAKAWLYTLVALCQSVSLYPSGTVSKYTSMAIFLFSCGIVAIPAYTCMHLDSFKSIVGTAPPSLSPSPAPLLGREGREGRRLITDTL